MVDWGDIVKVFIVVRGVESVLLRQDDGKLGKKDSIIFFAIVLIMLRVYHEYLRVFRDFFFHFHFSQTQPFIIHRRKRRAEEKKIWGKREKYLKRQYNLNEFLERKICVKIFFQFFVVWWEESFKKYFKVWEKGGKIGERVCCNLDGLFFVSRVFCINFASVRVFVGFCERFEKEEKKGCWIK